jgi:4-hydroxybenzoate polyprenyltransferase
LETASVSTSAALPRLKLFLALSRTPHGLLDLATPALAALLWLGAFPAPGVTVLGLLTVLAGYTAVYALNDVVDYRADREKVRQGGFQDTDGYLDGVCVRHPLAQGLLSFKEGLLWTGAWAGVALMGAYLLNPVCALIFLIGGILETVYCTMLGVSHWRTLVSGVVKTLGGLAAVLAVDPHPSPWFMALLFLWLFFWEIGGQNIPADWHEVEEDRRLQSRTLIVSCGPGGAAKIIGVSLTLSVILSGLLLSLAPARLPFSLVAVGLAAGLVLLLAPARSLWRHQARSQAAALFNRASYYPLAILGIVLLHFWS